MITARFKYNSDNDKVVLSNGTFFRFEANKILHTAKSCQALTIVETNNPLLSKGQTWLIYNGEAKFSIGKDVIRFIFDPYY